MTQPIALDWRCFGSQIFLGFKIGSCIFQLWPLVFLFRAQTRMFSFLVLFLWQYWRHILYMHQGFLILPHGPSEDVCSALVMFDNSGWSQCVYRDVYSPFWLSKDEIVAGKGICFHFFKFLCLKGENDGESIKVSEPMTVPAYFICVSVMTKFSVLFQGHISARIDRIDFWDLLMEQLRTEFRRKSLLHTGWKGHLKETVVMDQSWVPFYALVVVTLGMFHRVIGRI